MERTTKGIDGERLVRISAGPVTLEGNLSIPSGAKAIVLFAHGSGSSRHSPRNRCVAQVLRGAGLATLLMDLLTTQEEAKDAAAGQLRFDINLLAERLVGATDWLGQDAATAGLAVGYFGASTGVGAALVAAAQRPQAVGAVVSRGGRPDLAGAALDRVQTSTLLVVGGRDLPVIALNREALQKLAAREKRLVIIPGATHLFEEPGALEQVAELASEWFTKYLGRAAQTAGEKA
jgi:dienelactone hydrolase